MFICQFGHEKLIPGVIFSIRSTPHRLWAKKMKSIDIIDFFYLRGIYIHKNKMYVYKSIRHEKFIPGVIFPIRSTPGRLWPKIGQINPRYRFFN